MAFERFTEPGKSFKPRVTLRKNGQISFSQGAINKFRLDQRQGVVLYYDAQRRRIGIQPTDDLKEEGAYRLNRKGAGVTVSAAAFLDYFDIPYEETRRFTARWDETHRLIVVDLEVEEP